MIIGGISRCSISVPDIEQSLSLYRDTIGLQVIAQGEVDTAAVKLLWGLPPNYTARTAYLRNAKQDMVLELVQLEPVPVQALRDRAETYDFGFFHILFLVPDSRKIERIFAAQKREWLTHPYHFPPLWSGSEVAEGWAYGPAREIIATLEYFSPPVAEEKRLPGDFWTIHAVGHCVSNMAQALSFYCDGLGLQQVYEGRPQPGFYDKALHLLPNTGMHVVLVKNPRHNSPAIELFQTTACGRALEPSPAKLGIFTFSFESDNLDADTKNIQSKGFSVIAGPIELKDPLYGKIQTADIEGPDKTMIEVFQKVR